ncbi:hypothetical protein IGK20_003116 [Enterococcus sp. AZ112]
MNEIGVAMLETLIQEADYVLRQSPVRKREWYIQRNEDTKICATLLGPVKLTRTYYKHKKDGHFSYLLDNYLGVLPSNRIDIGLEAKLLETATERSYQQTVEQFQHSGITSKETIKNVVHRLDKRVTNSNKVFNPYFLAKFPLLENGLITGTRNRVAKAIK